MKKIFLSIGSMAVVAMPIGIAISCGSSDTGGNTNPGTPESYNLTNLSRDHAHSYFRGNGAVSVGDELTLTIGGTVYKTTWTQAYANREASARDPQALFNIVIEAFTTSNPSLTRQQVLTALGSTVTTSNHHNEAIA